MLSKFANNFVHANTALQKKAEETSGVNDPVIGLFKLTYILAFTVSKHVWIDVLQEPASIFYRMFF